LSLHLQNPPLHSFSLPIKLCSIRDFITNSGYLLQFLVCGSTECNLKVQVNFNREVAKMSNDQGNNQGPVFDDGARPNAPTQQKDSHEDGTGIVPPVSTDRSTDLASNPQVNGHEEEPPAASPSFGAPPMGDPAEPSSHPDNRTAAEQTTEAAAPEEGPLSGAQDGGLRRQQSESDVTQTDRGFGGQANNGAAAPAGASDYVQTPTQPGKAGTTAGVGQQPGSPYVETAEVPPSGKGKVCVLLLFVCCNVGNFRLVFYLRDLFFKILY
jgi:hypothetical protein